MIDLQTISNFCQDHKGKNFYSPTNQVTYSLWPSGQIEKLNSEYQVQNYLPQYIGFGTDGGDEMLTINTNDGKIYSIPFIPMDEKEAVLVSENLDKFATLIEA
jgi:hypothetical protein